MKRIRDEDHAGTRHLVVVQSEHSRSGVLGKLNACSAKVGNVRTVVMPVPGAEMERPDDDALVEREMDSGRLEQNFENVRQAVPEQRVNPNFEALPSVWLERLPHPHRGRVSEGKRELVRVTFGDKNSSRWEGW